MLQDQYNVKYDHELNVKKQIMPYFVKACPLLSGCDVLKLN